MDIFGIDNSSRFHNFRAIRTYIFSWCFFIESLISFCTSAIEKLHYYIVNLSMAISSSLIVLILMVRVSLLRLVRLAYGLYLQYQLNWLIETLLPARNLNPTETCTWKGISGCFRRRPSLSLGEVDPSSLSSSSSSKAMTVFLGCLLILLGSTLAVCFQRATYNNSTANAISKEVDSLKLTE